MISEFLPRGGSLPFVSRPGICCSEFGTDCAGKNLSLDVELRRGMKLSQSGRCRKNIPESVLV
jgi:hypothetical protein